MNIHNNTPFRHQVMKPKQNKKKQEILAMADLGGGGRSWLSYTWRRQIEAQRRQRKRETNL